MLRRLATLLVAVLAPSAAAAQSDGPIRLTPPAANPFIPPAAPRGDETPRLTMPPDSAPAVERRSPAGPVGAEVEVKRLEEPGPAPPGVLDEGAGLGPDVWHSADPADVERLLRELPAPLPERALSALVQRLLLTRAAIGTAGGSADQTEVAALRALALVRLGNVDGGRSLAAAVTEPGAAPMALRAGIDALLIENETDRACDAARDAVQAGTDVYAQRVLVFCQIVSGRKDEASVGLDVLRESAQADDPLFIALAEKLLGFGVLPKEVPAGLQPLHFVMWRATNDPVPAEAWRSSDPSIWRAVAASPDAPLADRIEAAEHAVTSGGLPSETLASLYRLLEGKPGERDLVATDDPPTWSVRERALLFQNAAAAESQPERAAALQRLFGLARARGGYEAAVLAAGPIVGELEPSARLTFFVPDAARAYLLVHDVTSAEAWAELARREREVNPIAARDAAELQPLFALTGGSEAPRLTDDDFAAWWQRALETDATSAPDKAVLIVDLLEALGEPVPSSAGILIRRGSRTGGLRDATGATPALAEAVVDKARGRTILEVAHLLGAEGNGPGYSHRVVEAVRALRLVGLEGEARRLAIEAAIDAGI